MRDLSRLLRPRSIAVIGGGAWGRAVITQARSLGFDGPIWPVHPTANEVAGQRAFQTVSALPGVPDACFIGVNRKATLDIVRKLATIGAGGAICFASGFAEAAAEDPDATDLQQALRDAAGEMPFLGPNCYGFINYLDGPLLWPDQQGGARVSRGVAIVAQSSNIAINMTMQRRGLPLAYVVTAGNQAQTGVAEIGMALLDDPRVTALGLHIEGFGDLRQFEALAAKAARLGKPIVALKLGRSAEARAALVSHTASIAGSEAGAAALLARLNIARLHSLPAFLETLKLLHACGPLASNRIASISCSGGEASLAADSIIGHDLVFPPLSTRQKIALRAALGPMVALANPLDYNTYIWRDTAAMGRAWAAMMEPSLGLTMILVDFPRADRCDASDWECAIKAALAAKAETGANVAMVATLPELMPEDTAARLLAGGVVPLLGLTEAISAIEAAAFVGRAQTPVATPLLVAPHAPKETILYSEARAKAALAACGLTIPNGQEVRNAENAIKVARQIGYPLALKVAGYAHKSEAGAVALGISSDAELTGTLATLPPGAVLAEEMVSDAVAEMLIGVTRDPAHGMLLTLAAGGVLAEILDDSATLLIPSHETDLRAAIGSLKIARLLSGYRGKPAADISAIVGAIMAVQDYVIKNAATLDEVEINPLLCCPTRAVAADALIRQEDS